MLRPMTFGPHYSAGCRDVLAILKTRGRGAQAALARKIKRDDGEAIDPGTLANLLSGRRKMTIGVGAQIEADTGIACARFAVAIKAPRAEKKEKRAK